MYLQVLDPRWPVLLGVSEVVLRGDLDCGVDHNQDIVIACVSYVDEPI